MNNKKLLIIILCVSIFILSIGLATFSSHLSIKSSTTVSPNPDNFKVIASASETDTNENILIPNIARYSSAPSDTPLTQTGTNAIIKNGQNEINIENLSISFDTPGQIVNYTFYIHNIGRYRTYLKLHQESTNPKCTALEGTNPEIIKKICLEEMITSIFYRNNETKSWLWLNHSVKNVFIEPGEVMKLMISFTYKSEKNLRADGPFNIDYGNIGINFSTAMFE